MLIYNFVRRYNISKTIFISYFVSFALIIYFLLCAIFGSKGIFSYLELKKEIANQDIIKQDLLNKMQIKKNAVEGMNVESLDLDLLDEEARRNLGYSNKNEVVIYQNEEKEK